MQKIQPYHLRIVRVFSLWLFLCLPAYALTATLIGDVFNLEPSDSNQSDADTVSNGKDYLVVWSDFRDGSNHYNIYAQRVSETGDKLGGPFKVSDLEVDERLPSVASDGSGYLAVWKQFTYIDDDDQVYGQRINADGSLAGGAFRIDPDSGETNAPNVVWGGQYYLVTWPHKDNENIIFGRKIGHNGNFIGSPFAISSTDDQSRKFQDAAFNGERFLVVWRENDNLRGQLLDADGNLVGSNFAITDDVHVQTHPEVATDGKDFVVTWTDSINDMGNGESVISAQRFDQNGLARGSRSTISDTQGTKRIPQIAWGNGRYLIIWHDEGGDSTNTHGRAIDANGRPDGDEFTIAANDNGQTFPATASNGSNFIVVWEEQSKIRGQMLLLGDYLRIPSSKERFNFPTSVSTSSGRLPAFPDSVQPIAFGDLLSDIAADVELPPFDGPADLYLGYYAPSVDPANLHFFTDQGRATLPVQNASPEHLTNALRLVTGSMRSFNWSLAPIAKSNLPAGQYHVFLVATPHGDTDSYYLWLTGFEL